MIFRKLWLFASRVFVLPIHLFFISLRYTLPVYIRSCLHFLSISRHHSRYCSPSSTMIRRPCVQDTFFTMKLHVPIKTLCHLAFIFNPPNSDQPATITAATSHHDFQFQYARASVIL
ncbi:hypothetical protein DM01DRAFT_1119925 [Hesseltinella vesiculosa]|uniref:Uncharacterized protein n=1 Tax=Hesseltinella vesiculosa TaxID=101127 RepID=A0A1X2GTJ7_9FUNG|nr:hypothetical protein DM01DRAFT_1119925 [Hesseltinella vesiculosa]